MKQCKLKRWVIAGIFSGFCGLNVPSVYAVMPVIDSAAVAKLVEELTELEHQGVTLDKSIDVMRASSYVWSNDEMMALMNSINTMMQEKSRIAYSASNLDSQFKSLFPGYATQDNYKAQYQTNANETLNTINGSLQSIGMNTADFENEKTRLDAIHNHVQSAQGQTQAIQAMSEVSEELVTQTQSLRQIVSAQANSEMAYQAQAVQKEAATSANLNAVFDAGSTTLVTEESYRNDSDNEIKVPY